MGSKAVWTVAAVLFGWLLVGLTREEAPVAVKLVMGLPVCVLISIAVLRLRFPVETSGPEFWKGRRLNLGHPWARFVLGYWAGLGLVWMAAVDELARHDFSRMWGYFSR